MRHLDINPMISAGLHLRLQSSSPQLESRGLGLARTSDSHSADIKVEGSMRSS